MKLIQIFKMAFIIPIQEVGGVQEIEHDTSGCNRPRKHRIWLHGVTVVNSPNGDNSINVYTFVSNFHHIQLSFPDIVLQLDTNARKTSVGIDLSLLPRFNQHFPIAVEYNGNNILGLLKIKRKDSDGHYIEIYYDHLNKISCPLQGSIIKISGSSVSWIGQ